jgi:uncharacterized protein YjdB/alpha-tubulin suppressor-like RCC1 family protein
VILPSITSRFGVALKIACVLALLSCAGGDPTGPVVETSVASISVTVSRPVIHVGDSVQAVATLLSSTSSVISGRAVAWSTDKASVATVGQNGVVTAVGTGVAQISASADGKVGQMTLTVTVVPIGSIGFVPDTGSIVVGATRTVTASVKDSLGVVVSGRTLTWSSSDTTKATVSSAGVVAGISGGTADVKAAAEGKSGVIHITLIPQPIGSISFVPDTGSVLVGRAILLAVLVKDNNGNTLSGRNLSWTTSDGTKATASNSGVVTGLAAGTVDVTATAEGISGVAHVKVLPVVSNAAVANVTVTIPRTAFRAGEVLQAAALPLDSLGGVLSGRTITWSSSNPEVASVSSSGQITGLTSGSATISADVENKTGQVAVQVSLVPVSSVTVNPGTETVSAGATVAFNAILKDSANRVLTGRSVTWTSAKPNIASVSEAGVVSGLLVGTADIVASSEGRDGHATVTVNTLSTPVATITVSPANTNMSGGGTKQLSATLRDANGNVLGGRPISWTSSNPDRASVSSTGLVTASPVDAPVVVTATVEGKSATSSIGISTFVRLSAGSSSTCGLTADGTAYCWGLTPTKVQTDLKFVAISSGSAHTCGIAVGALVYCWGSNSSGQLGSGSVGVSSSVPVPVSGGYHFVSIAAGTENTCATTADGEVYCWGLVKYNQLRLAGDVDTNSEIRIQPWRVGGGMVAVVAGLDNRFCSVDAAGLAYCWPVEFFSIQGSPFSGPNLTFPISSTIHFATLRVGVGHVCGIEVGGQAYCWGRNDRGQLGDGTTTNRSTPTLVAGGLLFESLAAGGTVKYTIDESQHTSTTEFLGFSCGITLGGKAYCWGANEIGQLGLGTVSSSVASPQAVVGGILFTGLRGGAKHICGLAVGGAAYCWGSNASGQFGDGTTTSSSRPTQIFGN